MFYRCRLSFLQKLLNFGRFPSGANPDFSKDELLSQLEQTNASVIFAHPDSVAIVEAATRERGLPLDRVVWFNTNTNPGSVLARPSSTTVGDLVGLGLKNPAWHFTEKTLGPGEGRTKVAFLNFSSGTTGKPKVRSLNRTKSHCVEPFLGRGDPSFQFDHKHHPDGYPQLCQQGLLRL